nr:ATP synthase F0 subunit 6 [Frankliniella intonsa]
MFKMSLFLSFDPNSSMTFLIFQEMNWLIMLISLLFLSLSFFTFPSRSKSLSKIMFLEMGNQLKIAIKTQNDSSKIMFISIFFLIFFSNFIGLVPNSFTSTSHITINLLISLPLWMGFFLYGWKTYSKSMFSHLVPNGTPMPLISFMVIIELISTSIRPFTLSIRLMANMVSGHLLLTLMGNTMTLKTPFMVFILSLTQLTLLSLEMGVSMIQAYVFCILLTLYSDDSDFSN